MPPIKGIAWKPGAAGGGTFLYQMRSLASAVQPNIIPGATGLTRACGTENRSLAELAGLVSRQLAFSLVDHAVSALARSMPKIYRASASPNFRARRGPRSITMPSNWPTLF